MSESLGLRIGSLFSGIVGGLELGLERAGLGRVVWQGHRGGYLAALESVMKIGDKVWHFDGNRRRYGADKSRPIWREHWELLFVVGENRVSWLLGISPGTSVWLRCPKKRKPEDMRKWAFSEAEIDERQWDEEFRWKILDVARYKLTTTQLREVAQMIGFDPDQRGDK